MPRKPMPAAPAHTDTLNHEALAADSAALTVLGTRSAEVAALYDDGQSYDRARVIGEAKFFMSQSAEAMLEAGKRLIVIKENEAHGDFVNIVTGRLGLEARHARKMMQAAVKYLAPALESKRPALAVLGKTKLLELVFEPDDDLIELAEGGTVAGLDLAAIDAMSTRELRAALTESKKAAAAKDHIIAKRSEKIARLEEAAERRRDPAEQAQLDELQKCVLNADVYLAALVAQCAALFDGHPEGGMTLAARQAIDWVAQRYVDAAANAGISIDILGERSALPGFMAPLQAQIDDAAKGRKARKGAGNGLDAANGAALN